MIARSRARRKLSRSPTSIPTGISSSARVANATRLCARSDSLGTRRFLDLWRVPEVGLEQPAQKARGKRAQRIYPDLRIGGRSGGPVVRGEQALSFAAEQQRAEYGNVADHRVEGIGRNDRALEIELVGAQFEHAVGGHTDRAAVSQEIFDNEMVLAVGEVTP